MENQFFIEEKVVFDDPVKASQALCEALKPRVGSAFVEETATYLETVSAVYIFKEKGVTKKNWRGTYKPSHQVHFVMGRNRTVANVYQMNTLTLRWTEITAKEFRDLPIDELLDLILNWERWESRQQHTL